MINIGDTEVISVPFLKAAQVTDPEVSDGAEKVTNIEASAF